MRTDICETLHPKYRAHSSQSFLKHLLNLNIYYATKKELMTINILELVLSYIVSNHNVIKLELNSKGNIANS